MKKLVICLAAGLVALVSCDKDSVTKVKNPITVSSPTPTEAITKVDLSDTEKG